MRDYPPLLETRLVRHVAQRLSTTKMAAARRRERLRDAVDPPWVAPRLLGRRRRGQGRPCRSVPSGDRLFELDFGAEAVAITPDRQHRQFAAALPVSHRAVLRRKASIDLDPVPFRGMSDVIEQQIVLLGPKERHRVEALPRPEHIAGSRLALPFGDNPVLDADRLAGQPVGPPGLPMGPAMPSCT